VFLLKAIHPETSPQHVFSAIGEVVGSLFLVLKDFVQIQIAAAVVPE
jgi:hypothetical protein